MTGLTITYGGRGGPRSGHIREGRRGVANPSFTVRANETPPLRFNSDLGLRFPPDFLSTVPTNAEKLTYLRHEIEGALDLFANYQRKFLVRYFAFIVERCAGAAAALDEKLAWSGGLLRADDFVFSALWPLPDCTLAPSDDAAAEPLGACDVAFWTGRQVVALTLTGSPNRRTAAGDNGAAASALVWPVTIAVAALDSDPDLFSEPRFPPEFVAFWRGERVPSSPFRPDGLRMPADAIR